MTKEEIDNLKVGDVYIRIDDSNYPRKITCISSDPCSGKLVYFDNGITNNQFSYNTFQELRKYPDRYKLILKANNNMTKQDLKEGMIVLCKNGKKYRVINHCFIGEFGWNSFDSFSNDLKANCDGYDIVKVYQPICHPTNISELLRTSDLIWERKEQKEMTIAEIEEKLGLDPGMLRIKK